MLLFLQINPEVSANRMWRRLLSSLAGLFLILSAGETHASRLLEVLDLSPIVVEGDVLAIPIRCLDPDSRRNPPELVRLQLDGRDDLEGLVTWVGMQLDRLVRPGESSWT